MDGSNEPSQEMRAAIESQNSFDRADVTEVDSDGNRE